MEKHDKIIELLEKNFPTAEEQNYLNEIVQSDKDSARLVAVYNSLKTNIPIAMHLDTEIIGDFILYENGELPDDAIIPILADRIKLHLKNCLTCNEEYQMLQKEYDDVRSHLEKTIKKQDKPYDSKSLLSAFTVKNYSAFRFAFRTVASVSSITTPDYNKNIFSVNDNGFHVTRGRTSVTFQKGLDAVENGNYIEAIKYIEDDIKAHPEERSIFYSYFIIGLTHLKSAEKDFLGLFPAYDHKKVNLAIKNLYTSIEKNSSGNYDNLKLDAHYYLGRAYLLLENYDKAKEELNIVISSKGKFYNEAIYLIELPEMN
jgi:tetratricopeptide (TPR) repeat protein